MPLQLCRLPAAVRVSYEKGPAAILIAYRQVYKMAHCLRKGLGFVVYRSWACGILDTALLLDY